MLADALEGIVLPAARAHERGRAGCRVSRSWWPRPAVRNLIREGKTHQIYSAIQTGAQYGMQSLDASLAALVRSGKISQKEAGERASDEEELSRLLGRVRVAS